MQPAPAPTSFRFPAPLPDEAVRHFVDQGFIVVENLLDGEEIRALGDDLVRIARGAYPCEALRPAPAHLSDRKVLEGILCIHQPHQISPVMRQAMLHPRIAAVLARIVGAHLPHWDGSVNAMQSMLFVKPPGKPGQAWHQDEMYIPTRDRSLCGAWIAIDEATVANGCLWVLPGSHRMGNLHPLRTPDLEEFDGSPECHGFDDRAAVPVEVRPGSVVFFNGYLLHRSLRNRAAVHRRSLVSHYCNGWTMLPWHAPEISCGGAPAQPVARANYRGIVPLCGTDAYAWQGLMPPADRPHLRGFGRSWLTRDRPAANGLDPDQGRWDRDTTGSAGTGTMLPPPGPQESTTMFCNQCEQTAHGQACTTATGICGKDADIQSLQDTLLYGLKGMAAYKHHARRLGWSDPEVETFIEDALFSTMTNVSFDLQANLAMVLKCGAMNLKVMAGLDEAHVRTFGQPVPTVVTEGTQAGPGILMSGHDLADLRDLLAACEGTPVKVYTHGEMLPANAYPALRNHPNLAGHYGDAWQRQRGEFAVFPGPIVVNTNCIMLPTSRYADRLYTLNAVSVPGAQRITLADLPTVVAHAQRLPPCRDETVRTSTIGFHHGVVGGVADALLDAVKTGKVRRIFVIGGCDGHEAERNYFDAYARAIPDDCFILTLGCGKYRIRKHEYGTLLGLPRLLDMGQCNDSYSAVRVAALLAEKAGCGVNDLPLTLCLSWFEQKAVAVLLSLLHLGVKGIRIGPAAPGWLTPHVAQVLKDAYDLDVIGSDPVADVRRVMAA